MLFCGNKSVSLMYKRLYYSYICVIRLNKTHGDCKISERLRRHVSRFRHGNCANRQLTHAMSAANMTAIALTCCGHMWLTSS